jgi:D-amino peptidase
MKIFVMADMEGISGICRVAQVTPEDPHYQDGRRYLTWDVNACVAGCIQGGAKKVVVVDAHHAGFNFIWHELDPRAEYIQGDPRRRMPEVGKFDGLILLGYHSMAGTREGILEHTWSSKAWQNLWINGKKSGEVALDAAIAGEQGVPTIMVSGDDKTCREARGLNKGIVTAQVKTGLGIEDARLLPKEEAHKRIIEGAKKAVQNCNGVKPYKVKHPVRMRLELVERGPVPANRPGVKMIDGRTYEVKAGSVEEALRLL